ncbi:MAG: RNA polymerase sigma factor [Clostridiales bacterium]|nr:RNA polymerase sigma factor [Clostridiales bacterium]
MILLLTFSAESDKEKFDFLYARYKRLLFSKAYGILHDHALCEDAVSEAYLRIFRNLHKIADCSAPQTVSFLVTIVKNVALGMVVKYNRELPAEPDEQLADAFRIEETVIGELGEARILALVDGLKEEYRAVFLLKYARGCSHKEIADLLQTTENNVTVRLHRAKKRLAELLREEGYDVYA